MPPPKRIVFCNLGINAIMCLSKIGLYQDGQTEAGTGEDWYINRRLQSTKEKKIDLKRKIGIARTSMDEFRGMQGAARWEKNG